MKWDEMKSGMNNIKESQGTEFGDQWERVGTDDGIVSIQTFHQGLGLGFNLCVAPSPVKLGVLEFVGDGTEFGWSVGDLF